MLKNFSKQSISKTTFKKIISFILIVAVIITQVSLVSLPVNAATKLSTPVGVAFSSGTASWSSVTNASSYSVQLYKDSSICGSAVTVAGDTVFYDFNSAIKETGSYTFKVKAIGDGTTYADSDESAASGTYSYTAPGSLVSVAGKTDSTGTQSGVNPGNAIVWYINVENSKATLALEDIVVTSGAAVELYSVPEFQTQITGSDTLPLFEGGVTTAYIIVKSEGETKAKYYKVTITREGKLDYTINGEKFSWVNGIGTIYLNNDNDKLVLFTNPGEQKKIYIASPDGSEVSIEGNNSVSCTNIYIEVENDITLTIKDLNITAPGVNDGLLLHKTDNDANTTMTLIVNGTCNIKGNSYGSGIHSVYDQKLVITGEGVLNATGGDSKNININGSMGIRMEGFGGTPDSPDPGNGAFLTIEGAVTVNATGGDFISGLGGSGIQIEFGDIVIKGGTVNAKSGVAYGTNYNSSAAIKAAFLASDHAKGGNITILGGTVTATGGDAELVKGGDGIYAFSALSISGGTVKATGGNSVEQNGGIAIYSYEKDINISGSKVTALGGNGKVYGFHAIYSHLGKIMIEKGADVTAIGGNGTTATGGVGLRAVGNNNGTLLGNTVTVSNDAGDVFVRGGLGVGNQRRASIMGKEIFIATGNIGSVVMEGNNPRSIKNKQDGDNLYMLKVTADPAAAVVIQSAVAGTLGGSYTHSATTKEDGVAYMWLPAGPQTVSSAGYYSETPTVTTDDSKAITISDGLDMNVTGVRFATFDIKQSPIIAKIDVEMSDIGLSTGNFTITNVSNPTSIATINNVAYSAGKYTLTVSGMNLYDSYTMSITKAGYATYTNNSFFGTLASAEDLDLVNEPNIFNTYVRQLTDPGIVTIKNSTYASGAVLYSGAIYDAIDGNNGNPDNGTVARLVGIFGKAPSGAKAVKTLRPDGQVLQVANSSLIDGNPNYQETIQNGKDYYDAHKNDPDFFDNRYWETLAFVPMYSQIATERQPDGSRILVDPDDRFRIIEWYDNEACSGNPLKVIRLMVKVDYTGSITKEGDARLTSILGKTVTAGSEAGTQAVPKTASVNVANSVTTVSSSDIVASDTGATVTFYGKDSTFAAPKTGSVDLTAGGGTDIYIKVMAENGTMTYYKVTVNRAPLLPPTATGGVECVDVTNVEPGATLKLYTTTGALVSTTYKDLENGTYRFENVLPNKLWFYVTQYANGVESENTPFFGVALRTPAITGENKQITVSNIRPGAALTLYNSSGNPVATESNVTGGTYVFSNVSPGSGYYVIQSINDVQSPVSNAATVYSAAPAFVGGTSSMTVLKYSKATDLSDQLYVSDIDVGQTLTWSIISGPSHGTLSGFPVTGSTNGAGGINGTVGSLDTRVPGPVTYTPDLDYTGSDSFTIQVSDGVSTDTRTITVNVIPDSGSTITALDSSELMVAINNPTVSTINLNSDTIYKISGAEINRTLTINGNGATIEVLHGVGQGFDNQTIYHLGLPDANGNRRYRGNIFWYVKDGGDLTLNNLTLRNKATTENAQGLTGIFAAILASNSGNLNLSNVAFKDFWFTNSKFMQLNNIAENQGLYATYSDMSYGVYSDYNCTGTLTISDCIFDSSNAFRDAVHLYNGSSMTVKNSTFNGTDHPERLRASDGFEYGMFLYGGNCTIENNTIAGYDSKLISGYTSSGIALIPYNNGSIQISGNTIEGNDVGLDLTGGWKSFTPGKLLTINGIQMDSSDNGFKIGEAIKASNIITGNTQTDIFMKLDQDDSDEAFVYYSQLLSIAGTNTLTPTLEFSAGAKKYIDSAKSIKVELSEDNGLSWTTASIQDTLDTNSTSVVVNLQPGKTYKLRLVMTHDSAQGPNPSVTGYSESISFTTPAQYTLTYTSGGNGTISGSTSQTVLNGNDSTEVEAIPDTVYHFVNWSDGILTAKRTDKSVADNLSVTAIFAINTYKVSFNVDGGSAVSEQTINYNNKATKPADPTKTGYTFAGWFTSNTFATEFDFANTAITADTTVYAKWNIIISSNTNNNTQPQDGVIVLVNGKSENIGAGTTSKDGDKTVTTVTIDQKKLEEKLEAEGNNAVVTIPVNDKSDVVVGELNGQMVKNMESKQAVLEVKTGTAAYTLPAQQINIDAVSQKLGASVELKDIKVQVQISTPTSDTVKVVENSAKKGEFSIVVPPVDFNVQCSFDNKIVEISHFNAYVERTVAIPDGVDPSKITTGIVVEPDGTVRHVPTKITIISGKYYAKINSLTNSTYSVVWHPIEFKDVDKHWAKDAVNEMGSRMVVGGVGNDIYAPDRDITRAEFAAIMVKALGLKPGTGNNPFSDVKEGVWYVQYIETAYQYGIISGYGNGKFGPQDTISREQAMTMIAKAMNITGLKVDVGSAELEDLLQGFVDSDKAVNWAKESITKCIKSGIVSGRSGNTIAPKANITRAEVAVIVKKLLQKSKLI